MQTRTCFLLLGLSLLAGCPGDGPGRSTPADIGVINDLPDAGGIQDLPDAGGIDDLLDAGVIQDLKVRSQDLSNVPQVNLSTYGAVGDGVKDDTAAIQKAFDSEASIISDPKKTYLISSTLHLDQNLTQVIDFGGSKLIRKSAFSYMLTVDKRKHWSTNTTITNLDIDGNSLSGSLVRLFSRVHFSNMNLYDAIQTAVSGNGPSITGINISIYDAPGVSGQWVFDNVNLDFISSLTSNGKTGTDSLGEAHAFVAIWQEKVAAGIELLYKNSSITNTYGDDGNLITLNSKPTAGDISFTNNSLWFQNLHLADFQRRAAKVFIGNTTWINCDFYSASRTNPNIVASYAPAGLMTIGSGSSAVNGENHLVCGCTFNGSSSAPLDSWYPKVVTSGDPGRGGVEFRHCEFNGDNPKAAFASSWNGLAISGKMGDYKVCGCKFTAAATPARGNMLRSYGSATLTGSKMKVDTNNTYASGQSIGLGLLKSSLYDLVDLSKDCAVCPTK